LCVLRRGWSLRKFSFSLPQHTTFIRPQNEQKMPKLTWIGKDKVIHHDRDVRLRALMHNYGFHNGTQSNAVTNSGNKIIHGDNLEALKSLLPQYKEKIKCIYIDPPYNTGNEGWVYNDNVNDPKINKWLHTVVGKGGEDLDRHDKWLCMMYPRLKLLHQLLATDGAIFISIDDTEQAHLRLILDEIFGEQNFVNNIIWQKKYTQSNDAKYLSDTHDFIICYAKDKSKLIINLLGRNEKQLSAYRNPDNDPRGVWKATPLTVKTPSKDYIYPIETPSGKIVLPPNGRSWMYSKSRFFEDVEKNSIWFGKKGDNVPAKKSFLSEVKKGVTPKTIWFYDEVGHNHEANEELKRFELDAFFSTPKPVRLIERIVQMATNANDHNLILDSFAGSGTTAQAILNLNKADDGNRRFILIEMEDYAETLTAERIKKVINGYGNALGTEGGFDYYTLG
jgi:adenine-specific DNA-methyltransferase